MNRTTLPNATLQIVPVAAAGDVAPPGEGATLFVDSGDAPTTTIKAKTPDGSTVKLMTSAAASAATAAVPGTMSAADKAKLDTLQGGVVTLVAGTTALIAATVTANSRIVAFLNTEDTSDDTVKYAALAADRVVGVSGAGGGFKLTALIAAGTINIADLSVLDWIVFN
jgi:hypothetical protein